MKINGIWSEFCVFGDSEIAVIVVNIVGNIYVRIHIWEKTYIISIYIVYQV